MHRYIPVPNVYDSLVLDFPDAKFLLFETPVDVWMERIQAKALASQAGHFSPHYVAVKTSVDDTQYE